MLIAVLSAILIHASNVLVIFVVVFSMQIQLFVIGDRGHPSPTSSDFSELAVTILDDSIASQPASPPELSLPDGDPGVAMGGMPSYVQQQCIWLI